MLIITSPSKTQNEAGRQYPRCSLPLLQKKSREIISILKKMDIKALEGLLATSDKLTAASHRRIQALTAKPTPQNARQALFTYRGEAYSAIPADFYDDEALDFAQGHLLILSALYGLLRPLDLIQPYRLEMAAKLSVRDGDNLYDFWRGPITTTLNELLAKEKHKQVINLASSEYSRVIDRHRLDGPMITITFRENVGGSWRAVPIHAKRARGAMVHHIIANRIKEPTPLQEFDQDGYLFDRQGSSDSEWLFLRR